MKRNGVLMYCLAFLILLSTGACANYKDIPYFQNVKEYDGAGKGHLSDMIIMPKDELVIFVKSDNDESVAQFNFRELQPLPEVNKTFGGIVLSSISSKIPRYLVENDGTIDFPVLGRIRLAGLTIEQANDTIKTKVRPFLQKDAYCIVNTIIDNYQISVLGEVKSPNTFTLDRKRCSVLEALAMAGDMTIYGKRDNLKLLRENSDGTYEVHELDMRDANVLNSPYYYLRQRDILYVEPNEAMTQNSKIGQTTQLWVRGTSITISLGSLLYRVLQ